MSADLQLLVPEFRDCVQQLLSRCASRGCEMQVTTTLRDPYEQARLWRQSRGRAEIDSVLAQLASAGAPFLAHCLSSVGPQNGPPVTQAPPGFSWHQWGEAVDCAWLVDGQVEDSVTRLVNGVNGYNVYAEEAVALGLTAGASFSFQDWSHVQLRTAPNPMIAGTPVPDIDSAMAQRFGA